MSLQDYKEKIQKYGTLKQIPIEALPYILVPPKQTSGFWGSLGSGLYSAGSSIGSGIETGASYLGSGLESIGSSAWDGISYMGGKTWDGISWTGDQIGDFASWATGYGDSPDKAMEDAAKQTEQTSSTQLPNIKSNEEAANQYVNSINNPAISKPQAMQTVEESSSTWSTIGSIASDVGSGFMDLVKAVGAPLGAAWISGEMKKDMVEEQMKQRNKSRQQAQQYAQNNLQKEKKKRINQTVAYLVKHKQQLKQLGYDITGNNQLKNRLALEILKRTHGQVPNPGTPITKFFSQQKQEGQVTLASGGGIASGGGAMSFIQQYWYYLLPAAGFGLYFLIKE